MDVNQIPDAVLLGNRGLWESDMKQIRCFVTRNILEREASEYHLSFALKHDSCVVIAMGEGPAEMHDFYWVGWDRLRIMLPDPHEILFIGKLGQWDWSPGSGRWLRSI